MTLLHEIGTSHSLLPNLRFLGAEGGHEQKSSSDHNMLTSVALGEDVSALESSMDTGILPWAFEYFCQRLPNTSMNFLQQLGCHVQKSLAFFYLKKEISLLPGGGDVTFSLAIATTLVLGVFFPRDSLLALCLCVCL